MEANKYILDFQKALIDTPNKTFLIDSEIRYIEDLIQRKGTIPDGFRGRLESYEASSVFQFDYHPAKFFKTVFRNYLINNAYDFNTIEESRFKEGQIINAKKAINFAEYYKWLKELNSPISKNKTAKKSNLSHKQKMLALHYLGLDLSKFENTNSAKILSQILDLDYDNTRKYLSYVSGGKNTVRTKSNLQKIQNLFENQNLNTISNKIKVDIEKF